MEWLSSFSKELHRKLYSKTQIIPSSCEDFLLRIETGIVVVWCCWCVTGLLSSTMDGFFLNVITGRTIFLGLLGWWTCSCNCLTGDGNWSNTLSLDVAVTLLWWLEISLFNSIISILSQVLLLLLELELVICPLTIGDGPIELAAVAEVGPLLIVITVGDTALLWDGEFNCDVETNDKRWQL